MHGSIKDKWGSRRMHNRQLSTELMRARGPFILLLIGIIMPLSIHAGEASNVDAQDALESKAPSSSALPTSVKTPVRLVINYPPKIGEAYYPAESRRRGEEGGCTVRLLVLADGTVPSMQLISSTGFPHLDIACWNAFINWKARPATVNDLPISSWANIPVFWRLRGSKTPVTTSDAKVTPHISDDYLLNVGPDYYPAVSRQKRQEGVCLVHVKVSERGAPESLSISKSTGFAPLDQACLDAIQSAKFIAGIRYGDPISAETDILINWRLTSP
jgi:TonB family protein